MEHFPEKTEEITELSGTDSILHLQNTKHDNAYYLLTVTPGKLDHFLLEESSRSVVQIEVQSPPPTH
jgi:hypothetical protein